MYKWIGAIPLSIAMLGSAAMSQTESDEITLHSGSGKSVAYIANDDDSTIYLWDGKPVAYLHGVDIFGFNGKHLGWFSKGTVYDDDGEIVGAAKSRLKVIPEISPIKSIKEIKPIKSIREIAPIKPIWSLTWSDEHTLKMFLMDGAD